MMRKRKKSMIIWTVQRISAVFLAVIAGLVLFFLWFITGYMKDSILDTRKSQVDMGSRIMASRLEAVTGPILSLAAYTPAVRLVSDYYREYSPDWMNAIRNVDAYLQNTSMFSSYITDINLIGEDGEAVYSLNDILKKDYPYTRQQWFQEALRQSTVLKYAPLNGWEHLYRSMETPAFSLIYPITRGSREVGYVLMEIDLYRLADFLTQKPEEDTSYLITNEQGRLIAGSDVVADEEWLKRALSSLPVVLDVFRKSAEPAVFEDRSYYYIVSRLAENGWNIILRTGRDVILSPVRNFVIAVSLLAIAAVFGLLLIMNYSAKRIGKPLNNLVARINAYDGSKLSHVETYENAPAEVAVIGERFESMAGKISDLIQNVYVAELCQKEAELEALVNQINPHFLYNVLQLIETKAVLADNREIEDMIQALSQMLRYTMERGERKVPVEEELEYIRNYVMFYQQRFPDMFTCEINCPEELKKARMLKFLIQPLAENSIRHGFDQKCGDGRLVITVEEAGEELQIVVWDNGKGISPEKLEMLRRSMEEARRQEKEEQSSAAVSEETGTLLPAMQHHGIGVVNTNARIRLVYGTGYGITVESVENEYTRSVIRIRMEREENV